MYKVDKAVLNERKIAMGSKISSATRIKNVKGR